MRKPYRIGAATVLIIAVAVFWRTAFPTITWWDSSSYSLAAATLGIQSAPGSLILTLLGWPLSKLPFGSPAYTLNLFAGALAAVTAMLVYALALRVHRGSQIEMRPAATFGAVIGALTFAFSNTLWEYATHFTPYILTTVFTGLILWTMIRWREDAERPDAWRRIAILGLLFGLDFSVHRTNALLMPSALVWILLRRPDALRERRTWVAGATGLVAGLAVQLLIIPMTRGTTSLLHWNDPSNLSRFWSYISLEQLGGGFLVQFFPRKAAFWSVQVADFLRVIRDNFFHWNGSAGVLGAMPGLAALYGMVTLCRRQRQLGVALLSVLLLHAAMTVMYFNIPADFFRTLDRHYLPVCVTLAVFMAYGFAVALEQLAELATRRGRALVFAGGLLALLAPVSHIARNRTAMDGSRRYFARDFGVSALAALPPNAIYFTSGDNDTFPLLYMQAVERVRPDVRLINLSVATLDDFEAYVRRLDPSFPLAMTREERRASQQSMANRTVAIAVPGNDSLRAVLKPSFGATLGVTDIVYLDIMRANAWRRPVCFAITTGSSGPGWLKPYVRFEGIHSCVQPVMHPPIDVELARANLRDKIRISGYDDRSIIVEMATKSIGYGYHQAFAELAKAQFARGQVDECRETVAAILAAVPPDRLGIDSAPASQSCR